MIVRTHRGIYATLRAQLGAAPLKQRGAHLAAERDRLSAPNWARPR